MQIVHCFAAQRQSQNNTLRHQAKDLEFSVEKEERLKKELEVQYTLARRPVYTGGFMPWFRREGES